jgi:hypothetical protein
VQGIIEADVGRRSSYQTKTPEKKTKKNLSGQKLLADSKIIHSVPFVFPLRTLANNIPDWWTKQLSILGVGKTTLKPYQFLQPDSQTKSSQPYHRVIGSSAGSVMASPRPVLPLPPLVVPQWTRSAWWCPAPVPRLPPVGVPAALLRLLRRLPCSGPWASSCPPVLATRRRRSGSQHPRLPLVLRVGALTTTLLR